jgi:hypothetical protein
MPHVPEEYAAALSIDQEHARRAAEGIERVAAAFQERMNGPLERASVHVVAGSYWALVDVERAMEAFRAATERYRRIGSSYAIVTAICGGERRRPPPSEPLRNEDDAEPLDPYLHLERCYTRSSALTGRCVLSVTKPCARTRTPCSDS